MKRRVTCVTCEDGEVRIYREQDGVAIYWPTDASHERLHRVLESWKYRVEEYGGVSEFVDYQTFVHVWTP